MGQDVVSDIFKKKKNQSLFMLKVQFTDLFSFGCYFVASHGNFFVNKLLNDSHCIVNFKDASLSTF